MTIASPPIPVLLLAANVISSNTRVSVSFFSSNAGALASSSGGDGGDRDEAGPAQRLYLHCCCKSVNIMGRRPRKTYAESVQEELLQRAQLNPSCDLLKKYDPLQSQARNTLRLLEFFVAGIVVRSWVLRPLHCSRCRVLGLREDDGNS